jgi:hypothetical protein
VRHVLRVLGHCAPAVVGPLMRAFFGRPRALLAHIHRKGRGGISLVARSRSARRMRVASSHVGSRTYPSMGSTTTLTAVVKHDTRQSMSVSDFGV